MEDQTVGKLSVKVCLWGNFFALFVEEGREGLKWFVFCGLLRGDRLGSARFATCMVIGLVFFIWPALIESLGDCRLAFFALFGLKPHSLAVNRPTSYPKRGCRTPILSNERIVLSTLERRLEFTSHLLMFFLVSFIKGKVNLSGSFHIQERIRFLKLEALSDLSQSDLELITKISQDLLHNPHRLF